MKKKQLNSISMICGNIVYHYVRKNKLLLHSPLSKPEYRTDINNHNLRLFIWLTMRTFGLLPSRSQVSQGQDIFCRFDESFSLVATWLVVLLESSWPFFTILCAGGAPSGGSSHFRLRAPGWSRLRRRPRRFSRYSRCPLGAKWVTANSRIWPSFNTH